MYERKNWPKRIAILLILAVLCLIPFGGAIARYWMARPFTAQDLARYEALCVCGDYPELPEGTTPYRTGKVILVVPEVWMMYREGTTYNTLIGAERAGKKVERMGVRRIDEDWFRLDEALRASTPEEVSTVIICEFAAPVVGHYVSEGQQHVIAADAARRRQVLLKVYDLETERFIGQHKVLGPRVKQEIRQFESQMGDRPDIAAFVRSMPVRN